MSVESGRDGPNKNARIRREPDQIFIDVDNAIVNERLQPRRRLHERLGIGPVASAYLREVNLEVAHQTLDQIRALPKVTQNTRHVCVEGWDVIGSFGGVRISDFLASVGADATARFLAFECADDYYESLDMATALHPNSLLCYEMYGKPLDRGHGAPLRLSLPTKLGYKSAKYLTALEVTNILKPNHRAYWADLGYSWFAGL